MKYAATITFGPDLSRLTELRPLHRAYLAELRDAGKLVLSGPFSDRRGGMTIFEAGSEQEVDEILKADPYAKNGIFASWEVREWTIVMANRGLVPE
jgi:uncharacterized protein YciI